MLPELHAERQMAAIEAASVPHMTDSSRASVVKRLTRAVRSGTRHRSAREAIATLPIPIEYIPKAVKPDDR